MQHDFQIVALEGETFAGYFSKTEQELKSLNAMRLIADKKPGFPCRVSLQDAEMGEVVLLLSYVHQNAGSPYQSSGAIFIRKNAKTAHLGKNEIPNMLRHRLLSVRAYNADNMMLEAMVIEGKILEETIHALFEKKEIAYLHIHNAKPGCYNCLVQRA